MPGSTTPESCKGLSGAIGTPLGLMPSMGAIKRAGIANGINHHLPPAIFWVEQITFTPRIPKKVTIELNLADKNIPKGICHAHVTVKTSAAAIPCKTEYCKKVPREAHQLP